MNYYEEDQIDNKAEILRLTGRAPSAPYNRKKNQEIQKNIIKIASEAREKHLSYGQLQAQRFLLNR